MPIRQDRSPNDDDEYEFRYVEDEKDQPTIAIIEAVSWVKDTDVEDLDPISKKIDVDALNEVLSSADEEEFYRSSGTEISTTPSITFEYEETIITVMPGRFTIKPVDGNTGSEV